MSETRLPVCCLAALLASCATGVGPAGRAADVTLAIENERRRRSDDEWAGIREAAGKGDAWSQCELGIRLYRRPNDPEGGREGVAWLGKAARQGHAGAMYHLGKAHHDGRGLGRSGVKDYRKAVRWFLEAAGKAYAPAMVMVGKCHASGGHGLVQDLPRAREWFEKAAKHEDALALYMLGGAFRWRHEGAGQDWPRSFGFYERAARLGHRSSQYIVGQFLEAGIGVEREPAAAVEWYRRAADQNDRRAQRRLGWCHEQGVGVEKDINKAIEWYEKVATPGLLERKIARLEAERVGRTYTPPSSAPQYPVTEDVEVTLVPERKEYEIGEPVDISMVYTNVGKGTYSVDEGHFGIFHSSFKVTDRDGLALANPYQHAGPFCLNGPVSQHVLGPGGKVRIWRTLNECVRFARPGTYTVSALASVRAGTSMHSLGNIRRARAVPLALRIRDFDREKRARDIETLVSAYTNEKRLPRGLPFEKQLHHVSSKLRDRPFNRPERYRIVRLLAFFGEPSLIPFFLDVLERKDVNGYAYYGLLGMPDRAAVVEAFKERLEHPEKHNATKLLGQFTRLLRGGSFGLDRGLTDWKAGEELRMRHEEKALGLLKSDTEYRYAYLVPGLLGGADDLFLVDYVLRSEPDRELLRKCSGAMRRVKLGREHVPFLEPLLQVRRDWDMADAAITQLVRLDRGKYLPVLLADAHSQERRFSPEVHRLLAEEVEEAEGAD